MQKNAQQDGPGDGCHQDAATWQRLVLDKYDENDAGQSARPKPPDKQLGFKLEFNMKLIGVCLQLHNFIINFCVPVNDKTESPKKVIFEEDWQMFVTVHPKV